MKAERARIANQIEKLGPEGLKEVERKLDAAKEDHGKPIPTEILTSFPIPDVKSICWIPVQTLQEPGIERRANPRIASMNGELQKHIESDGEPLPFFVEYNHVEVHSICISFSLFIQTLPSPTSFVFMHFSHWINCPITFVLICLPTSLPFSLFRLSGKMESD